VTPPAGAGRDDEPLVVTPDMLATPSDRARPPRPPKKWRVEFEQGISYHPPITLALIVLNVGLFVWQVSVGALENEHTIVAFGALQRENVLAGEWWRLLTASVLHGTFGHVMGNAVALYVLGMGIEHAIGGARTALVYVVTALGASSMSIALSTGPSVGASGAVFGLMGAVTVFLIRHRDHYEVRDKRIGGVLAAWAGYQVLIGLGTPYIDNGAHVGGLLTGAAIGGFFRPRGLAAMRRR
jgi:rhomboid protease GluP